MAVTTCRSAVDRENSRAELFKIRCRGARRAHGTSTGTRAGHATAWKQPRLPWLQSAAAACAPGGGGAAALMIDSG